MGIGTTACARIKKGFTLVELMVVCAILSTLAIAADAAWGGYLDQRKTEYNADLLATFLRTVSAQAASREYTTVLSLEKTANNDNTFTVLIRVGFCTVRREDTPRMCDNAQFRTLEGGSKLIQKVGDVTGDLPSDKFYIDPLNVTGDTASTCLMFRFPNIQRVVQMNAVGAVEVHKKLNSVGCLS